MSFQTEKLNLHLYLLMYSPLKMGFLGISFVQDAVVFCITPTLKKIVF